MIINMEKNLNKHGFILIDKPIGPTSHDMVNILRKITMERKIGHAGTLDPLAEGLLIMAIGRQATRKINEFTLLDKTYIAEIKLGEETDTYDKEGDIVKKYKDKAIKKKNLKQAIKKFIGQQKQIPPMYSAKKIKGKKLYNLARQNIVIDREANLIEIKSIKLLKYKWPIVKIKINCSSGTYIRSLAYDLGLELFCGAHLFSLKRTKIGSYKLKKAYKANKITKDNYYKLYFKKI